MRNGRMDHMDADINRERTKDLLHLLSKDEISEGLTEELIVLLSKRMNMAKIDGDFNRKHGLGALIRMLDEGAQLC